MALHHKLHHPDPRSDFAPGSAGGHGGPAGQPPPVVESTSVECTQCGYNLTGTTIGGLCPECGALVAGSWQVGAKKSAGMAIASMGLGIVSLVAWMLPGGPFTGIAFAIVGLVLSVVTVKMANRGQVGGLGMAMAGIACSALALAIYGLLLIALVLLFGLG